MSDTINNILLIVDETKTICYNLFGKKNNAGNMSITITGFQYITKFKYLLWFPHECGLLYHYFDGAGVFFLCYDTNISMFRRKTK